MKMFIFTAGLRCTGPTLCLLIFSINSHTSISKNRAKDTFFIIEFCYI